MNIGLCFLGLNFGLHLCTLDWFYDFRLCDCFSFWNPGLCVADLVIVAIGISLSALWITCFVEPGLRENCGLGWNFISTIGGLFDAVLFVQ